MEVTIKIPGLENLTAAIEHLAATNEGKEQPNTPIQAQASINTPVQMPATSAAALAVSQPVPQMPQAMSPAPVAQPAIPQTVPQMLVAQQVASPVPTTAVPQEYTQDQLAVAMTGLVDRGMQPQVMGILNSMGCQTLLQVPKERYPELVLKLREAGAVI